MRFKLLSITIVIVVIVVSFSSGVWFSNSRLNTPLPFIPANSESVQGNEAIRNFLASNIILSDAIRINTGDNIQRIVDDAPAQSVFLIGTGIHRLQNITPRDGDHFIGESGAILNGSIVLSIAEPQDNHWILRDGQLSDIEARPGGVCAAGYERCNHPYDLYVNHHPLQHVASIDQVDNNSWFFDYDRGYIVIGQSPENKLIELSFSFHAFEGEASSVVIENLTIEKYGGFGQLGAIRANNASNWVIRNNTIQLNSAAGINFGDGMEVMNNRILNNGQIGISGEGDNVVVSGNEIAFNNYANYDAGWEAGATKFVSTENLLVRNNYIHDNNGQGLWTDIDNINTTYEYNLVINNSGTGILHEISYDAVIRNNIVRYNATNANSVYSGGQIMLSSSGNVAVYSNDVVTGLDGGNSIVIVQQQRGEGEYGVYQARNNMIYGNQIAILTDTGEMAAATDVSDIPWFWEENTFNQNRYYGNSAEIAVWGWQNQRLTWQTFREFQESEGEFVSTIPVNALIVPSWQELQSLARRN